MPSFRALSGRFFGNTAGTAAGVAAGSATARTLDPLLQSLTNKAWAEHPVVPPDAYALATGVAQGQVPLKQAQAWALEQGLDTAQFAALVNIADTGPGAGEAFRLWRRTDPRTGETLLDDAGFARALKRLGIEDEWIAAMLRTKYDPLDPADLARGIHKSVVPDPGLLAVPQPKGVGKVPAYPVYPIDALAEAEAAGIDKAHLGVLVGLQGNPMGAHEAAQATFRGVIDPIDYDRAIAEGNTRNEWGEAIFEQTRQIPSPTNYVEAHVRNWIDGPAMAAGTARHGMTADDTNLLFLIHGRPLSWHQVFIGLRRGGKYDGPTTDIDPAFLKALQESDIRPEWYHLAWAQRYNYPAAFVLRALTQAGDIPEARAEEILLFEGWEPALAKQVAARWAGGTGAATSPEVKSARTKLLTTLHTAYVKAGADDASVITALQAEDYPQATIDGLLQVWGVERAFLQGQSPNPPAPST